LEHIDYQEDQAQNASCFSAQSLADIEAGLDAHIDDPELLSKRDLLDKFTPLSTLNAIIGKHKECGITSTPSWRKNPNDEGTNLFSHHVHMPVLNIKGHAEESSKKLAHQKACQKFLKNLFPAGTTWNQMIHIVQNEKDKLN
jgi:hypothetical protein